ncbi:DUF4350 domain-containing protein [Schaalia sp. lx-260]|uniref:DUF4350 domain-containing protein n=1 Tax=Schaalia sp. lx-260 TaxID=2899082 RepID=UPI001E58F66F|nr:DUF4350 domain-containing protein [Schaalia sp. lx-260]MCD4549729.1 hypothetical protein [Schaalia sp. lx-260]
MTRKSAILLAPTPRVLWKKIRQILTVITITLCAGIITFFYTADSFDKTPLSPDNPGPQGARALVQVLREHGVKVHVASSARDALVHAQKDHTILVVPHPWKMPHEISEAFAELPSMTYIGLQQMYDPPFPGVTVYPSRSTASEFHASCDLPAAQRARTLSSSTYGVQLSDPNWIGCFPLEEDVYTYAEGTLQGKWRALFSDSSIVTNQKIAEHGNASLAISTLGRTGSIVWYTPSPADTLDELPDLTPPFLIPMLFLLGVALLAYGCARGQRLGRLVCEDIPTPVPSAETVIGRARLLKQSGDYGYAAHLLRVKTAEKLASSLGIAHCAAPEELHAALTRQGIDEHLTYHLLWGKAPETEKEFLALAHSLNELEESISHD